MVTALNPARCSGLAGFGARLWIRTLWSGMLLSAVPWIEGCGEPAPTELPSVAAVAELDRAAQPPLYQLLYDTPSLPASAPDLQRVRLLIWMRHMALSRDQLQRLEALRELAEQRRAAIASAEQEIHAGYTEEAGIYARLWQELSAGAPLDAPQMTELIDALRELRAGGERERELLAVRLQGIRAVLDAERELLITFSPRQEALLTDALFLLRDQLDPVANPGDFQALVGSIYDPGQYAVLTRGTDDYSKAPLNIGALWADQPTVETHELHLARREVLLFLVLLEPALESAIAAALVLAEREAPPPVNPPVVTPPVVTPPTGTPVPDAPTDSPPAAPPG